MSLRPAGARPAPSRSRFVWLLLLALPLQGMSCEEPRGFQVFASPQTEPVALSADGATLYVAHTTAGRVVAIDTATGQQTSIDVGMEPVSVELRPDGQELWVANHLSDSVSVISTASLEVVATIQDLDASLANDFDEPADIAFASDAKAYVSLSSTDRIAVIDVASRAVTGHIDISAQDPRAIAVRNGLLYVAAFESGNQTQISACNTFFGSNIPGDPCSIGLVGIALFAINPNIPGLAKNIIVEPAAPDRDLFVFDTTNEQPIDVVSGLGTLLYGVAVDGNGRAFVTQTDARNSVNGNEGEFLDALDNRIFLNRVGAVSCTSGGCGAISQFDLEPPPPTPIPAGTQLATPHGIRISDDDAVVVGTAAGTSRLFTQDAGSGAVLGILDLGQGASLGQQIPRGLALRSDPSTGAPQTAYVLNTLANTISVVDLTNPASPTATGSFDIGSGEKIPAHLIRGRIAFMNAFASGSDTFSCESCHPDGNTDQLLWRIGGECQLGGCGSGNEARTTMPVRGLKNTLPLHWDGTLGDPFGGPNGEVGIGGNVPANCSDEASCFRHLVDASLSGVMCDQSDGCAAGGELLDAARTDMASFLASVAYPPARMRPIDDVVSGQAMNGFADFFVDQGGSGNPNTCADSDAGCHELPLGAATNSATLQAFDAPTMRGMTDRFLQFSLGLSNAVPLLELANQGGSLPGVGTTPPLEASIQWDPAGKGYKEITTFGAAFGVFDPVYNVRPLDIFQMFEEASTGTSGAVGRQVRLDVTSTSPAQLAATTALLDALELADVEGRVNLQAAGIRAGAPSELWYRGGVYRVGALTVDRATLIAEAQAGTTRMTVTAWLPGGFDLLTPQPLIATDGSGGGPTGDPPLPILPVGGPADPAPFVVTGTDVLLTAVTLLDGAPVSGSVSCVLGTRDGGGTVNGACVDGSIQIDLASRPADGLHLLQLQNPSGPFSNELPICVGNPNGCD